MDTEQREFNHEAFAGYYAGIPGFQPHLERIRGARIMVVGIGALGNEVVKNLALFDVGYLFLCDMDTVEWANLSHSVLFRKQDNGVSKVSAAARAVKELNPRIVVQAFHGPLSEVGLGVWRSMDVIVAGLDNRGARLLIDRACGRAGKDWIDAGLGSMLNRSADNAAEGLLSGAVQIFSPRNGFHYENYLMSDTAMQQAEEEASNSRKFHRNWLGCMEIGEEEKDAGRVPTTPAISSLIGAIQAQEAIRMLSPGVWGADSLDSQRLSVDAAHFRFERRGHPKGAAQAPLEIVSVPEFRAAHTTLREFTQRAKRDLGPGALTQLGFQYCRGLRCDCCEKETLTPFKLGAIDAACPVCGRQRAPMAERGMPDHLTGDEDFMVDTPEGPRPFLDMTLRALGVPLYEVLTAAVSAEDPVTGRREISAQIHYELSGDALEALGQDALPAAVSAGTGERYDA